MKRTEHTVGIVAKVTNPLSSEVAGALVEWLELRKVPHFTETETAKLLGISEKSSFSKKDLIDAVSVLVVLGGDGTLISSIRHPKAPAPIVIGVNLGTLGFMTEIAPEELMLCLEAVLSDKAKLEERPLLDAVVERDSKRLLASHAVNDVVLTKEALARIFAVELDIDGDFVAEMKGDGVIVATPGGSTAYSLSAGGSIVHPGVPALLVTSICPHSLSCRPLVIPQDCRISMKVASDTSGPRDRVFLTLDGQEGMELLGGDTISVTTSSYRVLFAKSPSKNYFNLLQSKLKWAQR